MNRKRLSMLIKLLLFAAVLALIYHFQLRGLNISQIHLNLKMVVLAFFLFQLKNLLLGIRLCLSARMQGYNIPIYASIMMAYKVWFLMLLLPIPGSEDLFRFYFLRANRMPSSAAVNGIILDRVGAVFGLAATLLIGGLLLVFGEHAPFYNPLYPYLVFFFLLVAAAVFYKQVLKFMSSILQRPLQKILPASEQILKEVIAIPVNHKLVAASSGLAFLGGGLSVVILLVLTGLAPAAANTAQLFIGVPFFYLSASLPLSYEGLGLMETSFFLYLKFMNLNTEVAFQVAAAHFFFQLTVLAFGGLVFALGPDSVSLSRLYADADKETSDRTAR